MVLFNGRVVAIVLATEVGPHFNPTATYGKIEGLVKLENPQHPFLNGLVSMALFDDYHRTVVGYHGTGITAALRLVNRVERFRQSERDYDWLGRGIYFWEYGPKQALKFAEIRQGQARKKKNKTPEDQRRATEPLAVVACMIRLSFCLD